MTGGYWDRFGRSRSLCHRLPPALKLLLTVAVVTAGLCVPVRFWPVHGVLAAAVFAGHTLARIPMSYLARRVGLFLPVVAMLSLSVPISQGFAAGWTIMAAILFRSSLSFLSVLWLVNVMPFEQLLVTLRRFRAPAVFVAMLAFMYRYSFVVWDELDKMRTARRARSCCGGMRFRWRQSIQLIGMLLVRAMGRAERVHGAMCSRGWDGQVRFLPDSRECE
ncbi:MAG: energy-coupling factor transporter transmembrane component T family protein [Planctomycetaceae bacterium]